MITSAQSAETFTCTDCHQVKPVNRDGGTGYGTYDNDLVCYACCAIRDRAAMRADGRRTMYFDEVRRTVGNWPGTLTFPAAMSRTFRHNLCRFGKMVYFAGPDGEPWSGRTMGDTMLIHCRRISARAWARALRA